MATVSFLTAALHPSLDGLGGTRGAAGKSVAEDLLFNVNRPTYTPYTRTVSTESTAVTITETSSIVKTDAADYVMAGTETSQSTIAATYTIPSGVNANQTVLLGGGINTATATTATVTCSNPNAVITTLVNFVTNGTSAACLYKLENVVDGDVVTITMNGSRQIQLQSWVFQTDFGTASTTFTRGGSQNTNVTPSVTTTPGQKVFVWSMERTAATPTTVTSKTNSNGRTVNTDYYADNGSGASDVSFGLFDFVESGTSSGTTTITYSDTGTSGISVALPVITQAYSLSTTDTCAVTITEASSVGLGDNSTLAEWFTGSLPPTAGASTFSVDPTGFNGLSPSISITQSSGQAARTKHLFERPWGQLGIRTYVLTPATWAASAHSVITVYDANETSNFLRIAFAGSGTPGQIRVLNSAGTSLSTSSGGVMANSSAYRLEFILDAANSLYRAFCFPLLSDTPIWDSGFQTFNFTLLPGTVSLGNSITTPTVPTIEFAYFRAQAGANLVGRVDADINVSTTPSSTDGAAISVDDESTVTSSPTFFYNWHLDDLSGNPVESTGGPAGAVIGSGLTYATTGLVLDGGTSITTSSGNAFTLPTSTNAGSPGGISFWWKATSGGQIIWRDFTSTGGSYIDLTATNPVIRINGTNHTVPTLSSTYADGNLHQFVLTTNGSTVYFYVDGLLVDSWARVADWSTLVSPMYFGRNGTNAFQWQPGIYDEVGYSYTLISAAQVAQMYLDGTTAATLVTKASTDTAAITITESNNLDASSTSNDTTAVTISESRSIASSSTSTDTCAVTISETNSILVTVTTTDTSAITISDSSSSLSTLSRTDTSAITITETSASAGTASSTDTSAITITESAAVLDSTLGSDGAGIGISETSSVLVTISTTDTSSITISETDTTTAARTSTDTAAVTISDISAVTNSFSSTDTSALTISETSVASATVATTDTSAISVADSSSVSISTAVSGSESVAVSIAETSSVAVTQPTTDTAAVTISETSSVSGTMSRTDTSAITIAETSNVGILTFISSTDTCAITISETSAIAVAQSSTDTAAITIADASLPFLNLPGTETVSISITESSSIAVTQPTTDTSSIAIAETSAVQVGFSTTDTTALTIAESSSLAVTQPSTDSAAVTIAETRTILVTLSTTDTCAVTISDSSSVGINNALSSTDTSAITIADSSSLFVSGGQNVSASDTSAITISESSSVAITQVALGSESPAISVAETSSISGTVSTTDTSALTIAESSSVFATMSRTDTSAIAISESSSVVQQTNFPGVDTAAITISESSSIVITGTISINSTDTSAISVGESHTFAQTLAVASTDNSAVSVNETSSISGTMASTDTSSISISDSSTIAKTISTTDTSALSISESSDVFKLDALVQITATDTSGIHIRAQSLVENPFAAVENIRAGGHLESKDNFASELDNDTMVGEHNTETGNIGQRNAQIKSTGGRTQQQTWVE